MKDVKRYRFVDGNGYPALPIVDGVSAEKFVEVSDYDAALSKLAAESLRADTAEADLRNERLRADAAVGDANDAERELAAAEKRVSELAEVLKIAGGSIREICQVREVPLPNSTLRRIDAALNPKPEAGSHD